MNAKMDGNTVSVRVNDDNEFSQVESIRFFFADGSERFASDEEQAAMLPALLSASPSPVVDAPIATGERLEAEEKEMFRLADRLGYVCTPEPPHPDSPHVQEQEETRIAIKDEAREEAAQIADGFTCGGCGMDGKSGAAIRATKGQP